MSTLRPGDYEDGKKKGGPHFGEHEKEKNTAGEPADASASRADGFSAHGAAF